MSKRSFTDEELVQYFNKPGMRGPSGGTHGRGRGPSDGRPESGVRGYLYRKFEDARKAQAAFALLVIGGIFAFLTVLFTLYFVVVSAGIPSFEQLDNPTFQLATVAYTVDGKELARYARQNRSWATFDQISPHVIHALVATEDKRFYSHWGMDVLRTVSAVVHTVVGDTQGGSTITQQLARNLYNEEIGKQQKISRKLKEWVTAIQLERRYTKRELIEMYLNTVEFGQNAFGIEAAARTFFGKSARELNVLEAATLIGSQKAITYYNPVRNPENAKRRRNVVMQLMVKADYLEPGYYEQHRDDPVETHFRSSEITDSIAPYFAEYVRNWLNDWGKKNNHDIYSEGLVVYTTLDSRLQQLAQEAVTRQMEALQSVVDYEWSRPSGYSLGTEPQAYQNKSGYEPFAYFWQSKSELVNAFIRETAHFKSLREAGVTADEALFDLRSDKTFMDSLKAEKTRLEAGMVSIDPHNGYIRAWVGGRDMKADWYDHVAIAKRQPGSTFKPFVYTAAIDNGYSPSYELPDAPFTYQDPTTGQQWSPRTSGGASGAMMSLRQAIAESNNLVTARVITQLVQPSEVVFYAHRMGIKSELEAVPSLALGVSDVSLLELANAYSTLANGGLVYEPIAITRIEDRFGNVLFETHPSAKEALSEATAYTVVDMMRGAVTLPTGTANRIAWQFGLGDYDLAAKTGTTQNSADGWFMLMHPELVTGAWVGFNDRRIAFRSEFWGQGAHNALYLVGDFFRSAANSPELQIANERFPSPQEFEMPASTTAPASPAEPAPSEGGQEEEQQDPGRLGW